MGNHKFNNAKATSRHYVQYFEIMGNRAIYSEGWLAGTVHRAPWEMKPRGALLNDKRELYNTRNDFSLVNDLAAKNPAKLKELQDLFLKERSSTMCCPLMTVSWSALTPPRLGGQTSWPVVHP